MAYSHAGPVPRQTTISPDSAISSGRESAAPLEAKYSGGGSDSDSYPFDNARKRAARLANQGGGDGKIPEEPPQGGQGDPFGRARAPPVVSWANTAPTQMTPPPAQHPEQMKYANSADPNGQNTNRRGTDQSQSSVIVESDSGVDWASERKKDREERMLERTEREQERANRRREMDERAQERQERRKEREERALEREERRRERDELIRLKQNPNGISSMESMANAQKIHDLEQANGALLAELEAVKAELRGVKEAMQVEQEKTNVLVQYMKLFQFPDEREIQVNKLRNLVASAQQKLATMVNLKTATWWMAIGPSQTFHDRFEKAIALLGNRRVDDVTSSLFQCHPAMTYVVEYNSRLGIQRNQDYTGFGWFPREVYLQAWNSLNKMGDEMGRIEPVAFHVLIDFVCSDERA